MLVSAVSDVKLPPPWTREGHTNAHAWFTEMLSHAPVAVDETSGVWQFLGFDASRRFLEQPTIWSIAKRLDNVAPSERIIRLLNSDPPLHKTLRAHFALAYRPQRIIELEKRMRIVCDELLDRCIQKGTFDVVVDLMRPFATIMICELIGIPVEGQQAMMAFSEDLTQLGKIDTPPGTTLLDKLYAGGRQPEAEKAFPYLQSLIERRRKAPQDDLVSALTAIPPDELDAQLDLTALLAEQFGAGTNTTVHVFTNILAMFTDRPELLTALKNDRGLIQSAIEETIRFHSPLQARPRIATQDIKFGDLLIPEGTTALVWLAAANVDPAKFENPLNYDIRRSPNPHVGFGFNEHFCLGAHLARMELRVMMEGWLNKIESFERAESGPLVWVDDFILHGLEHFQVTCKPHAGQRAA